MPRVSGIPAKSQSVTTSNTHTTMAATSTRSHRRCERSSSALFAPNRYRKIAGRGKGTGVCVAERVFAFLATLALCAACSEAPPAKAATSDSVSLTPYQDSMLAYGRGEQWRYEQAVDSMTDARWRFAFRQSINTFVFGSPYDGTQRAILFLRQNLTGGAIDAFLQVERGQFLCRGYDGCAITARFDDAPPQRFLARAIENVEGRMIVIAGSSGFVRQLRVARRVRIRAEFFEESPPIMEFVVDGFDETKLPLERVASAPRPRARAKAAPAQPKPESPEEWMARFRTDQSALDGPRKP
jgi:hypothetical protein